MSPLAFEQVLLSYHHPPETAHSIYPNKTNDACSSSGSSSNSNANVEGIGGRVGGGGRTNDGGEDHSQWHHGAGGRAGAGIPSDYNGGTSAAGSRVGAGDGVSGAQLPKFSRNADVNRERGMCGVGDGATSGDDREYKGHPRDLSREGR